MYASAIVNLAEGELGYKEKETNYNLDSKTANPGNRNWTKYARDLYSAGYYNGNKNGYAWCDVFVDWCFFMVANKNKTEAERIQCQIGPYGAGCTYSMGYYQQAGRLDRAPRVGDQIFFRYSGSSGADHTGIVVELYANSVVTIEGNSGNEVRKHTYARSDSTIVGYGHPKYTEPVVVKPIIKKEDNDVVLTNLKKGSKGAEVKAMQLLLIGYGYSCGSTGADGDFGANTDKAVRKFQAAKGIGVDGICGPKTWSKLLKGV